WGAGGSAVRAGAGPAGSAFGADPSIRCPHTPQNRAPGASGELHDGQFIPSAIVPHSPADRTRPDRKAVDAAMRRSSQRRAMTSAAAIATTAAATYHHRNDRGGGGS